MLYILAELFEMKRVMEEEPKTSRLSERRQKHTQKDVFKNNEIIREASSVVLEELEQEEVKPDFSKVRKANESHSL